MDNDSVVSESAATVVSATARSACVTGALGAWRRSASVTLDLAAGLEQLGYATLWLGAADGDLRLAEQVLERTSTIGVATGIVNIWKYPADEVAAAFHRVHDEHGDRFLLGLGVGHPEATGAQYSKPYRAMVEYLSELDAAGVPVSARVLAALGPRVLGLSAVRSAGAHPYLVTPEHTGRARQTLGADPLLVPDHKVVLDTDPERARAAAREAFARYLAMANYRNNLRSLGFDDADLADGGSDRVLDALYAWGGPGAVVRRLREHLDAGADQVAVNLVIGPDDDALEGFSAIATAWQSTGQGS